MRYQQHAEVEHQKYRGIAQHGVAGRRCLVARGAYPVRRLRAEHAACHDAGHQGRYLPGLRDDSLAEAQHGRHADYNDYQKIESIHIAMFFRLQN